MDIKGFIDKIIVKIKGLDDLGRLGFIRWCLFALALILIIPCELVKNGIVHAIFAIIFWLVAIAGIVLSVYVAVQKKKRKNNRKSY